MGNPIRLFHILTALVFCSCQGSGNKTKMTRDDTRVQLITLDPGHFHAALVQKEMYPGIDSQVYVYAPGGSELEAHLNLIKQYNERKENPTHWVENLNTGPDYLEKMLAEKKGNVVVLAGNNRRKTEYIKKSIEAGINVLGDKPMAINSNNFDLLEKAFNEAKEKNLLLYDIMTERSEITNILQKELAHTPEVFGEFKKGAPNDPSVILESVHFFYKHVSGKVLTRPDWFFDPEQQGDAITDVGTHLIDLVQWACFPGQIINYKEDITINSSKIWPTPLTLSQFALITNKNSYPGFLKSYVKDDSILQTHGNGEINYTLKNLPVKVTARWEVKAPEGSGDTHYSLLKGTKASLEIRQGKEESYQPVLYIIPVNEEDSGYASSLQKAMDKLNINYPGVTLKKIANGWEVLIPGSYKVGHEAHFAQVMKRYLEFLKTHELPGWEVPGMLAKYYTATKALEMASKVE